MAEHGIIRVLGIDPALRCTGYGMLDTDGTAFRVVDCGVIRTPAKHSLSDCLRRLSLGIEELLTTYEPDTAALEGGFFSRNAKTAMLLGAARGVVIAMMARQGVPLHEYAPRRIKQAVTGYGNADKQQVATVMTQLLDLDPEGVRADATDALATAVCHTHTYFTNQGLLLPTPI